MQADAVHDPVHQECDAGHVAAVLEQPDEEKKQHDLRKENQHAADAADEAVDQEVRDEALRQARSQRLPDRPEGLLDEGDRGVRPGEERLEDREHQHQEDDEPEEGVYERRVEPLAPGPARRR